MRTRPRRLDIKNNAEQMIRTLRGGAIIGVAVGFFFLSFGLYHQQEKFIFWPSLYVSGLSGVAALIFLSVTLYTMANNALFRDRDEMLAAIRILEAESRQAAKTMRDDFG